MYDDPTEEDQSLLIFFFPINFNQLSFWGKWNTKIPFQKTD